MGLPVYPATISRKLRASSMVGLSSGRCVQQAVIKACRRRGHLPSSSSRAGRYSGSRSSGLSTKRYKGGIRGISLKSLIKKVTGSTYTRRRASQRSRSREVHRRRRRRPSRRRPADLHRVLPTTQEHDLYVGEKRNKCKHRC